VTEGKDTVSAVAGLMVLLVALVLGLLVWTSYGVYAGQKTALQSLASSTLQMDAALAHAGKTASTVRYQLRERARNATYRFWPGGSGTAPEFGRRIHDDIANIMQANVERSAMLESIVGETEAEKQALAQAKLQSATIGQTRLQMALQLDDPMPTPMLAIVSGWSVMIFFGYGLLSRWCAVSILALACAAVAVGSAFFLIIDLARPYSGFISISPNLFSQLVSDLNR
jgi:hypothetical protein